MSKCICGKKIVSEWIYSRNKIYNHVCSRFCAETQKRKLPYDGRRKIPIKCYSCDNTFELKAPYNHANQRFCGVKCLNETIACRKGKKYSFMFTAIYESPDGVTSQDIYEACNKQPFKVKGARGVSLALRRWVARGVITMDKSTSHTLYRWTSDLRPGQELLRWSK